jgi:4-amino-4-deoxy-L-arabinose transferase-like glycosyltransferase
VSASQDAAAPYSFAVSTPGTLLTFGLLLLICFLAIGRSLWTPDEPREAEIAREMAMAPTVIPTLDGQPFIEKPPLYYWTVAGVYALAGKPSAAAARSVSAVAAFLTLLVLFLWGRREFSSATGLAACLGLASSVQFMISTHWVLIDPMLMLFTTIAAWAGWELIKNGRSPRVALAFYLSLTLALWTKGLVGPVLIGCGLVTLAIWERSTEALRRLYPLVGVAAFLLATASVAAAIYHSGGWSDLREWFWINHVRRFISPTDTGHDQPFYYYLSAIPIAVMPWWVPFADCFRPSRWKGPPTPQLRLKRYLASLFIGMAVFLSASATKRGIYLLPMLPPLFLLLAARATEWWAALPPGPIKSRAWRLQIGLVAALAGGLPLLAMAYLKTADIRAIVFLAALGAALAALAVYSRRGRFKHAAVALAACAVACPVSLIGVVAHMARKQKDMTPYVSWVGREIPPSQKIYAVGKMDETIRAIVPFVTGRKLVPLQLAEVRKLQPAYVLVQDGNGGRNPPELGDDYVLLRGRSFGPGRHMALWQRQDDGGRAPRP